MGKFVRFHDKTGKDCPVSDQTWRVATGGWPQGDVSSAQFPAKSVGLSTSSRSSRFPLQRTGPWY